MSLHFTEIIDIHAQGTTGEFGLPLLLKAGTMLKATQIITATKERFARAVGMGSSLLNLL